METEDRPTAVAHHSMIALDTVALILPHYRPLPHHYCKLVSPEAYTPYVLHQIRRLVGADVCVAVVCIWNDHCWSRAVSVASYNPSHPAFAAIFRVS